MLSLGHRPWGRNKPLKGWKANPAAVRDLALSAAFLLNDGGGNATYDVVANNKGSFQGSGIGWTAGQFGPCLGLNGSSSYLDCGAPLTGTQTQLSLSAWMYRASTSNICTIGWTQSDGTRFQILWYTDGNIYWIVENSQENQPNSSNSSSGWHHFTIVWDGTQSTNTTRMMVYFDGVLQTLAGFGVVPTTYVPTGNFYAGFDNTNTLYTTGNHDFFLLGAMAWTAGQVSKICNNPFYWMAAARRNWVVKPSAVQQSGLGSLNGLGPLSAAGLSDLFIGAAPLPVGKLHLLASMGCGK